jgi:hypothetical protein
VASESGEAQTGVETPWGRRSTTSELETRRTVLEKPAKEGESPVLEVEEERVPPE